MLKFYGIIGCQFMSSKVDKGSEVYRAIYNGVELSLYAISQDTRTQIPSLQLGFKVENLEETVSALREMKGVSFILDITEMPDGKKAIVLDPDGHSIELCQL